MTKKKLKFPTSYFHTTISLLKKQVFFQMLKYTIEKLKIDKQIIKAFDI